MHFHSFKDFIPSQTISVTEIKCILVTKIKNPVPKAEIYLGISCYYHWYSGKTSSNFYIWDFQGFKYSKILKLPQIISTEKRS